MKKGTKVEWQESVGGILIPGSGVVIADEDNTGHVAVARDADANTARQLIWCATTWLKVIEAPAASQPPTPPQPS